MDFGNLLKQTRQLSTPKVTQAEVAEAAGVRSTTVCDWEQGHRGPPAKASTLSQAVSLFSPKDARRLALAAGVDRGSLEFEMEAGDPRSELLAELSLLLHGSRADEVVAVLGEALRQFQPEAPDVPKRKRKGRKSPKR